MASVLSKGSIPRELATESAKVVILIILLKLSVTAAYDTQLYTHARTKKILRNNENLVLIRDNVGTNYKRVGINSTRYFQNILKKLLLTVQTYKY